MGTTDKPAGSCRCSESGGKFAEIFQENPKKCFHSEDFYSKSSLEVLTTPSTGISSFFKQTHRANPKMLIA